MDGILMLTHVFLCLPLTIKKLADKLGLESIEDLEDAIDAMQGIAADGSELETENLPREARVRSAYLEWCKEGGKTADESRFPQFSSNYLAMEEFSSKAGKEMVLNEYADCTEEEYASFSSKPKAEKKAAPAKAEKKEEPKADVKVEKKEEPKVDVAKAKADEEAAAKKKEAAAAAKKKQPADEKRAYCDPSDYSSCNGVRKIALISNKLHSCSLQPRLRPCPMQRRGRPLNRRRVAGKQRKQNRLKLNEPPPRPRPSLL
jgi:hypothetical protein